MTTYVPPPLPEEWADETACKNGSAHKPTSNEHADAWCVRCGERLLIPGYAGGPEA